jgi:hypothetical protein
LVNIPYNCSLCFFFSEREQQEGEEIYFTLHVAEGRRINQYLAERTNGNQSITCLTKNINIVLTKNINIGSD